MVTRFPASLLAALLAATPLAPAAPLDFAQALQLAEQHAAALDARRAAAEGARLARTAAGRLPDPTLSVGVDNLPISGPERFSWNREPMTMRRIGLMQEVPNAARRAAQREAADARAGREQALLQAERLAVRREAALAWLDLHFAQARLAAFAALEQQDRLLQDSLAARLVAGGATPADTLLARQEALDLADRRDELQAGLAQARARLQRWTAEPADALQAAAEPPLLHTDPARLLAGLERHAELLAFAPMLALARAEQGEAAALREGDWGWELGYGKRARAYGDMLSFQLRFELPVARATRQDPLAAARAQEVERLQAEQQDALRRVRADVEAQLAELQRLERQRERQQTAALPLARQRAELLLAAYPAGRAELGAVLAARRAVIEAELRGIELQSQLLAQQARLAYLIAE